MKRTLFRTVLAAAALSTTAFAGKGMNSEYFRQADGMTHDFTPRLTYFSANQKDKDFGGTGSKPETSTSGFGLGLGYDYGINEDMAFGLNLGISNNTTTASPKNGGGTLARQGQGLTDLGMRFQGRMTEMGPGTLIYGARANINLVKPTQNEADGSRNGAIPGWHSLMPYAGYELMVGPGLLGAKLEYELWRSDRTIDYQNANGRGFELKNRPGSRWIWGAFYEMAMQDWMIGASVDMVTINSSERSYPNAVRGQDPIHSRDPASMDMVARVYGSYMIDRDITLLPSVSYTQLMGNYREGARMESDSELAVGVAGRFTF